MDKNSISRNIDFFQEKKALECWMRSMIILEVPKIWLFEQLNKKMNCGSHPIEYFHDTASKCSTFT